MPSMPRAPLSGSTNNRTEGETTKAAICHVAALIGSALFPLNLVVPIVMMCLASSTPFVKSQAKESLNFQISVVIWAIISFIACFVFVGFFMVIALAICAILMPIIAACSAANGTDYKYPLIFRLVR